MAFFWEVGDMESQKTNIRTFKSTEWPELIKYCKRKRNRYVVQAVTTTDITQEVVDQIGKKK